MPPDVERALRIPPMAGTEAALARLEAAARRGGCAAAWRRALYLIDLFDGVRLAASEGSRDARVGHAILWRALGLPGSPGRGRLATTQVLEGIRRALTVVPASCRERELVSIAVSLLRSDVAPRRQVPEALAVALSYKRIARGETPLAVNAALRLVDWCGKAFRLAAGGSPALQPTRLNQCLFALFDADPSPYFQPDAAARPLDPPWTVLAARLREEQGRLLGSRMDPVVRALLEEDKAFFAAAAPLLPTVLDLAQTVVPASDAGAAYDRTPLVLIRERGFLVGGLAVLAEDSAELEQAIARRLLNDRRGRVTVAAASSCPAKEIVAVARAARRAGARVLELGVSRVVAPRAPAADVQATLWRSGPVRRLEAIPVSLLLFSSPAPGSPPRDLPAGDGYDRRAGKNEIALLVRPGELRLSSRDGVMTPVRPAGLRAALHAMRRAYPDDTSLVIVPDSSATNADLVGAAAIARFDRGEPLFPHLALSTTGLLTPPDTDLAPLLKLLARGTVSTDAAGPEASALLRCYHAALRAAPAAAPPRGTLLLQVGARTRVLGGTLRHAAIRRCATKLTSDGPPRKVVAEFSLAAEPAP